MLIPALRVPVVVLGLCGSMALAGSDFSSMTITLTNNSSCALTIESMRISPSAYWMRGMMPRTSTVIAPRNSLQFATATNNYNSGESGSLVVICNQLSAPIMLNWDNPLQGNAEVSAQPGDYTQIQLNASAGIRHPHADVIFQLPAERFNATQYARP